ncbi:MAG TPA: c-type cytochrome [Anaerolineae bacterium]|nr:c-type cytochrome [Anaerolineae bacterium]
MIDAQESKRRKVGLGLLSIVVVVFIALSGLSFVQERGRPDPEMILFQGYSAVDGKRVFQAYNCMGCHTMLGNGAYFGPDLTKIY